MDRITITLPAGLVEKADARAKREGRSRSWVLAEALRRFLAEPERGPVPGLSEQQLAQLRADMALTPEQRVRKAEAAAEGAPRPDRAPRESFTISFDRYEDYLEWRERDRPR